MGYIYLHATLAYPYRCLVDSEVYYAWSICNTGGQRTLFNSTHTLNAAVVNQHVSDTHGQQIVEAADISQLFDVIGPYTCGTKNDISTRKSFSAIVGVSSTDVQILVGIRQCEGIGTPKRL